MRSIVAGISPSFRSLPSGVFWLFHNSWVTRLFNLVSLPLGWGDRHKATRDEWCLSKENPEEVLLDADDFPVAATSNLWITNVSGRQHRKSMSNVGDAYLFAIARAGLRERICHHGIAIRPNDSRGWHI